MTREVSLKRHAVMCLLNLLVTSIITVAGGAFLGRLCPMALSKASCSAFDAAERLLERGRSLRINTKRKQFEKGMKDFPDLVEAIHEQAERVVRRSAGSAVAETAGGPSTGDLKAIVDKSTPKTDADKHLVQASPAKRDGSSDPPAVSPKGKGAESAMILECYFNYGYITPVWWKRILPEIEPICLN